MDTARTVAETATRRRIYNCKTFQEFEFESRLEYASESRILLHKQCL